MTGRTNNRHTMIGIDRLIRLEWLKRTAQLAMTDYDATTVRDILQDELSYAFRSRDTTVRGSLDKTLTILLRVWIRPDADLEPLRLEGLELIRNTTSEYHMAIHWGMLMAAYPFWGNVAVTTGRLLRLQGDVTASQVQRRLKEQYGERETVSRRGRYVLRAFIDWGVLQETSTKGTYTASPSLYITEILVVAWMLEACLRATPEGKMDYDGLCGSPTLFPFILNRYSADQVISHSIRLSMMRHGVDRELLMLGAR